MLRIRMTGGELACAVFGLVMLLGTFTYIAVLAGQITKCSHWAREAGLQDRFRVTWGSDGIEHRCEALVGGRWRRAVPPPVPLKLSTR
jgi:hypothetical protein